MESDPFTDPTVGYPKKAELVFYEDTDAENFEDSMRAHISIYDTRLQIYYRIPGADLKGDVFTWGEIAAKAFYKEADKLMLRRRRKGHPFDYPGSDLSISCILGWVTRTMGKWHRDTIGPWPTFHICEPGFADAVGRTFLAGIIAYAILEEYYTPWHVCYNWKRDGSDEGIYNFVGMHHIDCSEPNGNSLQSSKSDDI